MSEEKTVLFATLYHPLSSLSLVVSRSSTKAILTFLYRSTGDILIASELMIQCYDVRPYRVKITYRYRHIYRVARISKYRYRYRYRPIVSKD